MKRATLWQDECTILNGTRAVQLNSSQPYNMYASFSQQNAEFTHGFELNAGTYNLSILGLTAPNSAKLKIWIDGVFVQEVDFYSSSSVNNVVFDLSQVATLTTTGWHTLRGKVETRNPSATGWVVAITKFWLKLASD